MVVRTSGMMAAQAAATVPLRITMTQTVAMIAGADQMVAVAAMAGEVEEEIDQRREEMKKPRKFPCGA